MMERNVNDIIGEEFTDVCDDKVFDHSHQHLLHQLTKNWRFSLKQWARKVAVIHLGNRLHFSPVPGLTWLFEGETKEVWPFP